MKENKLFPKIEEYIKSIEIKAISENRKKSLHPLIEYIQTKINNKAEVRLIYICTHNSRRSHMAQVWSQTMAAFFDIPNVFSYSGGTEATALYPITAKALKNSGFEIITLSEGKNPVYAIKFAENAQPVIGFSKEYNNKFNPTNSFAAIMTCSQADEGCPFIAGAENRIVIAYDDPKAFDDKPQQFEMYQERSLQIATEMFYIYSKLNNDRI